ncbi:RNA-binding protein [Patescibacteria group bacterium]|nr:RNA-binding protein [Patescibacteria group bacterium]
MSKKLFVGNLPWSVNSDKLKDLFSTVGEVSDAFVMTDRDTGRSRGFGFVTFDSDDEAQAAIDAFNDKEVDGRNIVVNEAREKKDRY